MITAEVIIVAQKLIKIPELAAMLDVSGARARELARCRLIPSVRVERQLRFDPEAIGAWIATGGQALPGGWRREAE